MPCENLDGGSAATDATRAKILVALVAAISKTRRSILLHRREPRMKELVMDETASSAEPAKIRALTVDAKDGAALLGIGRTKFLQLNSSGRLPLPIRFGRSVRWRKQELADWL